MTFWMKTEVGDVIKLHDSIWRNRIYVHGDAADDLGFLKSRLLKTLVSNFISSVKFAYKRANLLQEGVQKVIEIELSQAGKARQVAETLEGIFQNPLTLQLYNIDVLPEQVYFYEKNIFPLGFLQVETNGDQIVKWEMHDDIESVDYTIPSLRVLNVNIAISSKVPRFDSHLTGIMLQNRDGLTKFEGKSESEIMENALDEITHFDPDIIVTRNGDLFALPFLYLKAQKLGINFNLNRDSEMKPSHLASIQAGGTTFSYGRILFKAKMQKLYGRVHLDEANTFVFDQCRFAGLFEITRLCRMPLHNSVRASIGKCLSSIQFYHASKRDILISWKPWASEDTKTFRELLIQDRGGLVLEPMSGIHERVGEIDFASLYPSIICRYNISSETLNCPCCKQEGHRIEGLDLHICRHQPGIVAESLKLPLEKRLTYRRLCDRTEDKLLKQIYNERAGALKWILVCCFGYLSYRNAKFGKIDSHIAVCGYARKTLFQAIHISENQDYRVVHGIVDSLWLSKPDATKRDYLELCDRIESETGFKIVLEGIYKWLVFLPSKINSSNQVANRYFGCFEGSNEMKVRGIEYRRGDAPVYFKLCQKNIFDALSKCDNVQEARKAASTECVQIFHEFAKRLEKHDVSPIELLITRRLSKNLEEYRSKRQLSVSASSRFAQEGLKLQAGQSVSYVISNYRTAGTNRAVPEELVENVKYDSERYVELLADCCATVLSPFGVTKQLLLLRSQRLL